MTKEEKVADQLLNLTDDTWFNPSILAYKLVNQPFYNVDRIMEVVAHIIHYASQRYAVEYERGNVCEGLILANHLSNKDTYRYKNLSLPKKAELSSLPPAGGGNQKDPRIKVDRSFLYEEKRIEPINIIGIV